MTRPEQQRLTRMVELLSEFYDSAREYWSETGHPGDLRHFDEVYTDALSEAESLHVRVAHLEEALRRIEGLPGQAEWDGGWADSGVEAVNIARAALATAEADFSSSAVEAEISRREAQGLYDDLGPGLTHRQVLERYAAPDKQVSE